MNLISSFLKNTKHFCCFKIVRILLFNCQLMAKFYQPNAGQMSLIIRKSWMIMWACRWCVVSTMISKLSWLSRSELPLQISNYTILSRCLVDISPICCQKTFPIAVSHSVNLRKAESIYLYFPQSSQLLYLCFCPVGLLLL